MQRGSPPIVGGVGPARRTAGCRRSGSRAGSPAATAAVASAAAVGGDGFGRPRRRRRRRRRRPAGRARAAAPRRCRRRRRGGAAASAAASAGVGAGRRGGDAEDQRVVHPRERPQRVDARGTATPRDGAQQRRALGARRRPQRRRRAAGRRRRRPSAAQSGRPGTAQRGVQAAARGRGAPPGRRCATRPAEEEPPGRASERSEPAVDQRLDPAGVPVPAGREAGGGQRPARRPAPRPRPARRPGPHPAGQERRQVVLGAQQAAVDERLHPARVPVPSRRQPGVGEQQQSPSSSTIGSRLADRADRPTTAHTLGRVRRDR